MIPITDQLKRLATLDARNLADAFRTISAREWDGRADDAWDVAAKDADCDPNHMQYREVYLAALIAECGRLGDEFYGIGG